jgi:CheY-like chemotaxis protein
MQARILIAEDDDLQGSLLRSALEGRGYRADIVTDGLAALHRLRTGEYDLALLDYHMPEVDGRAAATLLHDFLADADRPRLIAVTAAAQGLAVRDRLGGRSAFDAIVSKQVGLPALLAVVDDNLTDLAQRNIAMQAERGRAVLRATRRRRRQRYLALLGAAPGLVMAGAFAAGLVWAIASLQQMEPMREAAQQTTTLSAGTTALIGALARAESSERSYLASGHPVDRAVFDDDLRQVDHLLVAAASPTADGEAARGPQALLERRMQSLSDEVQSRRGGVQPVGALSASTAAGRELSEQLQIWATDLVSTSQLAVLGGLAMVRTNIRLVLGVLAAGVIYGLWNACRSWLRLTHRPRPTLLPHPPIRTHRLMLSAGDA